MATTLRLLDLLKCLNENDVSFVIVGGVAALLHGAVRVTVDLDVCAPLGEPNLSRLLTALRRINPRIRMRPDKMRLPDDLDSLISAKRTTNRPKDRAAIAELEVIRAKQARPPGERNV